MSISENLNFIRSTVGQKVKLVAVSKTKPEEDILEAYKAGQRIFGENKAQELQKKAEHLPKDIAWHMIGHLQRNKVKYIAPHVSLIHSVDSLRLLKEIDKSAAKNERIIDVLLQIHIAKESTKFGFDENEVIELLESSEFQTLNHIRVVGLMGMATNTNDKVIIESEFENLKKVFDLIKSDFFENDTHFQEISMGMSNDYEIAIEKGSTMVRIGSSIFGARNYH